MLPAPTEVPPTCHDHGMGALRTVATRPLMLILAVVAMSAGFAQFGATTALGDVAKSFGSTSNASSFAAQAGLSGSTLAIGIAIIRASSLAALPLTAMADRLGRRRVLYVACLAGLGITATAALSPGYWAFVALFALARPALTATNSLASVVTAELTDARLRVTALALVAAGAGVGAGMSAIVHGLLRGQNGFRVLFAVALVPAAIVAVLSPKLAETRGTPRASAHAARIGAIPKELRGRLAIVMGVTAAIGAIAGPANGLAFVYGENILKLQAPFVSAVVAASAVTGIAGLLIGRRLADHQGRRRAVVVGVLATAATSLYAYSGGRTAFAVGYLIGVCAAALLAPSGAAMTAELFPNSVRASAGGWTVFAGVLGTIAGLAVFGAVADATFGSTGNLRWAACAAFLPALPVLFFVRTLPETRGQPLS